MSDGKLTDVVPPEHLRAVGIHLANQIGFAPPTPDDADKVVWFRAGQQSIATTLVRWSDEAKKEPGSDKPVGSECDEPGTSE